METIFYFENGLTADWRIGGRSAFDWNELEETLGVRLTARDRQLTIAGADDACARAEKFFTELVNLHAMRKRELDRQDIEQLVKAYKRNEEGDLSKLFAGRIKVGKGKREVLPRSKNQLNYLQALREKDVIFGVGPAGTGKTYLAMAVAVSELLAGNVSRIVLTRPAREAGENLGFLPGSLEEKIMPYLRPLYDALYDMLDFNEASSLIERNVIEVAPLAFMRGRTLNNAFIILDEAQNTTEDQMLMFLTRLGFNSRCVITGDPSQSDLTRNERSGLVHAVKTLNNIREIGIIEFSTRDVVRHALLEKIIHAYTADRN
ncbi:MAG: PhoH family protein [Lentisphaerae bacterium]|nr:PhoH family protein [Lentisphaerota bacterium]